jgi:hypothetical protein
MKITSLKMQLRDNIAKCVNDLSPTRSAFKKNKRK